MTDPTSYADTRQRRSLVPWLAVALVAAIIAGGVFWVNHDSQMAAPRQKAEMSPRPDPAIEQIKQTLSSLQQTVQDIQSAQQKLTENVQGIQSDQKKLTDQVTDLQQQVSAQQSQRKILSDQVGALSARVDTLASANAESTPAAPQASKNRRGKR
jgi:chromosome segregation ATPase